MSIQQIKSAPIPPTTFLPPLKHSSLPSLNKITECLSTVQSLYFPPPPPPIPASLSPKLTRKKLLPPHLLTPKDDFVDSGYASAEEEDIHDNEDEGTGLAEEGNDMDEEEELDIIRSSAFERDYTIRWLTSFTARCASLFLESLSEEDIERLLERSTRLLSLFAGEDLGVDEDAALTRKFSFPLQEKGQMIEVELNDAPLLNKDHTSVGLQSWASSIVLGERICKHPPRYGFPESSVGETRLNVLELGAGTGLLSIIAAKILLVGSGKTTIRSRVIATDYHPSVLDNLESNIRTNFPFSSLPSAVEVHPLDWSDPSSSPIASPEEEKFDIVLAADVIYQKEHASWIKECVEKFLKRPSLLSAISGGIFHLIIPIRSTGRHEGMGGTVWEVFPLAPSSSSLPTFVASPRPLEAKKGDLAILSCERIGRVDGVGRADETEYVLFKIGWVV
ncbi:putative methyltransferase-domain-containing protein [Abortiporus biennis]|nr:putative methyltransferase-domain-containing protein [Abortiporus biennis]